MVLTKNKMKLNLIAVLNYSQAYKEPVPTDKLAFIRTYPTDNVLLQLSKINAILYREDDLSRQTTRALKEVVFNDIRQADQHIAQIQKIIAPLNQGIFSGPAIAELIKACLEAYVEPSPELTANTSLFAFDLFKTILIFNQYFYDTIGTNDLQTFGGLFEIDIAQQYYIRRERTIKFVVMLKFAFISKFFSEDPLLKSACLEYCKIFKLGTMWGLGQFFLHIFKLIHEDSAKEARHIIDRNNQDWPVLEQFVLHKSDIINKNQLSLHFELIPKPFYELTPQYLLLLDFNFFNYGLDQGIFYSFYKSTALSSNPKFNNFLSFKAYLALNYYEQYFIKNMLEEIFRKRSQLVLSTEKYQDFIVRATANDVFIFEVKMVDVHPNVMEKRDFPAFKDFLDKNFLASKSAGNQKNKGIVQIVRQINHLAEDTSDIRNRLNLKSARSLNIYPVIIYADANLDMGGVNEYISEVFDPMITPLKQQFQSIKPLLMMNGSTFLTYFDLLRQDSNNLSTWINDYFKSVKALKTQYTDEKQPLNYMLYNKSFSTHLIRKFEHRQDDNSLAEIRRCFDLNVTKFGEGMN